VVNDWNREIGLEIYENLLGVRPMVALVNEVTYSVGIVEHYLNKGYEAISMEWNNSRKCHLERANKWRYFPQKVVGVDGNSTPIMWI